MQVEELMIGDWVLPVGEGQPYVVFAIHNQDDIEIIPHQDSDEYYSTVVSDVEPIPLTGEILVNNGWRHFDRDNNKPDFHGIEHWLFGKCEAWRMNDNLILNFRIQSEDYRTQYNGKIQYVHELQHLLRICGIDQELDIPKTELI